MKFMRTMATFGAAHFALWWVTYCILLMFDFDVVGPSQSPGVLNVLYHLNHALMFPLLVGAVRPVVAHMPLVLGVGLASCIWAGCWCAILRACKKVGQVYPA